MTEEQIDHKIEELKGQLVGDMFQDMDLQQQIMDLKRQKSEMISPTVRPDNSDFECVGCGS